MAGEERSGENTVAVDSAAAIERFLASPALSESTRRAYRADLADFASWLRESGREVDDVDVRALAEYTSELGRARRGLAPTTIARRLSAVRSLMRHALGPTRVPEAALAPRRPRRLPETPSARRGRAARRPRQRAPTTARWRSGTARSSSSSTRAGSARPRRSRSTSPTWISIASTCTFAARAARSGSSRSARKPPGALGLWLRDGRPALARDACDALFLSARGRRLDTSTLRRLVAEPAPVPPRVRDAPARGRRRPAHDPGAPRPRVALDDADLQPRRRAAPPARVRPGASALLERCQTPSLQWPSDMHDRPLAIRTSRSTGSPARRHRLGALTRSHGV